MPHFDVIIYDQLESPILWIEDSADTAPQGRSLAIPVEYVKCVLEVKMKFTSTTVKQAVEHLNDLAPLLNGYNAPQERYKCHLPNNFICGLVFIELDAKDKNSQTALNQILTNRTLRGFFGGIILRGEGYSDPRSGQMRFMVGPSPIPENITKFSLLGAGVCTKSEEIDGNAHIAASLTWSTVHFSQFGFDLIAMMNGTYDPRFMSSAFGMGGG